MLIADVARKNTEVMAPLVGVLATSGAFTIPLEGGRFLIPGARCDCQAVVSTWLKARNAG